MLNSQPNSICRKCGCFSQGFSNNLCLNRLVDGSSCRGVLFSILEGELEQCAGCNGSGSKNNSTCDTCQGYGVEYVKRKGS